MGTSQKYRDAQTVAMKVVKHVKSKKLHDLLECDPQADPWRFGGSAELYVDSVNIMAHFLKKGKGLRFTPIVPPDDVDKVPKGVLKGFSAPEDFDPRDVAKKIRALCRQARAVFLQYGVEGNLYDDDFDADETVKIDCNTNELVFGDEDDNDGEEWKNGACKEA